MTDTLKTPDVAEMTRFLAVEVIGWRLNNYKVEFGDLVFWEAWEEESQQWRYERAEYGWSPDTVPADRDMLVEAMRKKGFLVDVLTRLNGERQALVYMDEKEGDVFSDVANTPGRVVLTAAYQAVKGMEEQHHDT